MRLCKECNYYRTGALCANEQPWKPVSPLEPARDCFAEKVVEDIKVNVESIDYNRTYRCTRCGERKHISEFPIYNSHHTKICKSCYSASRVRIRKK